jgi:hypothetical protein
MWGFAKVGPLTSRISWRKLVVLLAIFAIAASVATRTFHDINYSQTSAHGDPSNAMRQHLNADACELTKPFSQLSAILLPVAAPHAPPVEPDVRDAELGESLYNRPPPAISLL